MTKIIKIMRMNDKIEANSNKAVPCYKRENIVFKIWLNLEKIMAESGTKMAEYDANLAKMINATIKTHRNQ